MTRDKHHPTSVPTFQVLERRPPRPAAFLLACVTGLSVLASLRYAFQHGIGSAAVSVSRLTRSVHTKLKPSAEEDEQDDPNQIDVVYLGDAADAPVPLARSAHSANVHPTVLVRLPRFGPQTGLIPDSATGHLLYRWLAAFNQADASALSSVLPGSLPQVVAAQLQLRQQTGGFRLVSAKEIQPGLLVFRLQDQTPDGVEALGTLQMFPGSDPPCLGSFSLQATGPKN